MHEKCSVRTYLVLKSQSLKIRILSENNGLVFQERFFFGVNSRQLKQFFKKYITNRIIFK